MKDSNENTIEIEIHTAQADAEGMQIDLGETDNCINCDIKLPIDELVCECENGFWCAYCPDCYEEHKRY